MSGSLRILTHPTPPQKHDHVDILFANNKILRFSDPRRFGALLWTSEDPAQHPLIQNLGVEPLDKAFSSDYLWTRAKKSKTPIKSFIMNNQIVVGVGNIYATEALFLAGIYPNTPAKNLSIKNFQKLTEVIKIVLKHAIERGGTTLRDFVKSDGKPGYFSTELKAYGRAGLPCLQCRTILKSMCIQQRSTVYCEQCQSQ
jgi:formamidopyrimidine-DNA glycosylase